MRDSHVTRVVQVVWILVGLWCIGNALKMDSVAEEIPLFKIEVIMTDGAKFSCSRGAVGEANEFISTTDDNKCRFLDPLPVQGPTSYGMSPDRPGPENGVSLIDVYAGKTPSDTDDLLPSQGPSSYVMRYKIRPSSSESWQIEWHVEKTPLDKDDVMKGFANVSTDARIDGKDLVFYWNDFLYTLEHYIPFLVENELRGYQRYEQWFNVTTVCLDKNATINTFKCLCQQSRKKKQMVEESNVEIHCGP